MTSGWVSSGQLNNFDLSDEFVIGNERTKCTTCPKHYLLSDYNNIFIFADAGC